MFVLRRMEVVGQPRRMGERGEHVSFFVGREGAALRGIAFRKAETLLPYLDGSRLIDVAFTPQRNRFRGRTDVEALVAGVRWSE